MLSIKWLYNIFSKTAGSMSMIKSDLLQFSNFVTIFFGRIIVHGIPDSYCLVYVNKHTLNLNNSSRQ
jgi:hypothetical protein